MLKTCKVDGCDRVASTRDYCNMHYMRWWRHGDPRIARIEYKRRREGLCKRFPKEYNSYASMRSRCFWKKHAQYKSYGGRGITICRRWLEPKKGFANFLEDMGERPEGCSLDRIDNNGNYTPKNCRWSTVEEQSNNRRTNRYLEYHGEKHTIAEWARILNIPSYVIYNRCNLYKWPVDKILFTPYKQRKN